MYLDVERMRGRQKQKVTIGFSGSIITFSAMFNYGLLTSYQGMPIEKIFASQSTVANMLQNGMIDLAITFPPITGENVQNQVLIHDPLRLAVAGGHPLLKQMRVTLEDLQPYAFMSKKQWDEFFWPYLKPQLDTILASGKNCSALH